MRAKLWKIKQKDWKTKPRKQCRINNPSSQQDQLPTHRSNGKTRRQGRLSKNTRRSPRAGGHSSQPAHTDGRRPCGCKPSPTTHRMAGGERTPPPGAPHTASLSTSVRGGLRVPARTLARDDWRGD